MPFPALFLGDLIVAGRRELGLSQRDLAGRVCAAAERPTVTRHEISRYERESRLPTGTLLAGLAAALRLPRVLLRQSADLSAQRRRLGVGGPDTIVEPWPGSLIGADSGFSPQPMLLFGVPVR